MPSSKSNSLNEIIRKHVLKNAHDFGKANPGSVVGKVVGEYPDAKKDMKSTMKEINRLIQQVSTLSKKEIEKEMKKYEYVKKEEKDRTFEVPNAEKGKVITRFAPEPSGYPHIGHAKAAFLEYEVAKTYDGKMILRFDDTNPEKEKQDYVVAIKKGLEWLGIPWEKETYTSDNIEKMYEVIEKLIKGEKAYVCTASKDEISNMRTEGKALACRKLDAKENISRWKQMLAGKLKAVVLYKADLKSKNTVMHDPTLARVMTATHYRQGDKYKVWPSYDLAVVVMDYLERITHSMRSKEYELRNELYYSLFDALKWKKPEMIVFSRLAIKNAPISKRLITPLVTEKKVQGWNDPRLPTLDGLNRRGILPQTIKNFVLSFGLSKVESEPDWEKLLSENRKLIDPIAPRYFFVSDPIGIKIQDAKTQKASIRMHPKQELGNREIEINDTIYISKNDLKNVLHGIFRLKDFCNLKLTTEKEPHVAEYAGDGHVAFKLQWVSDEKMDCTILVPGDLLKDGEFDPDSLTEIKGYCEKNCEKLKVGDIIQFERFGFCRLDSKTDKMLIFIYSC